MPVLTKISTNTIADNAVTAAKTSGTAEQELTTSANIDLSGTTTGQKLQLGDAFTLTGDLTVNHDLVLGKVRDDGTGQSLTGDGKTLTGTGTLTMGSSIEGEPKAGRVTSANLTAGTLAANTMGVTGGYFFSGLQVFESSGTWTKPSGVTSVYVIVTGSGGGGGAAGGGDRGGPGGGAGGTALKWITTGLGATETITVGGVSADAGNGSTSSFGSHCSGTGGTNEGGNNTGNNSGGVGGSGVSGTIDAHGGGGMGGGVGGQGTVIQMLGSGIGGSSYWGGGGRGKPMGATSDGEDARAYGSGGGGAGSSGAGSKGRAGIVVVYEYKG